MPTSGYTVLCPCELIFSDIENFSSLRYLIFFSRYFFWCCRFPNFSWIYLYFSISRYFIIFLKLQTFSFFLNLFMFIYLFAWWKWQSTVWIFSWSLHSWSFLDFPIFFQIHVCCWSNSCRLGRYFPLWKRFVDVLDFVLVRRLFLMNSRSPFLILNLFLNKDLSFCPQLVPSWPKAFFFQ